MLPNFLVIGAEKCGTTWLHRMLASHPDIFVPATKELHFFNELDSNLRPVGSFERGLGWYERFFADWRGQSRVGEVTPMYLCDPQAPRRMAEVLPDALLVAILRHPADRAYAHYWMARAKGHTSDEPFAAVAARRDRRFIERGLYGRQLARFVELFGCDRLVVLIFEEVVAAPAEQLAGLAARLGVSSEGFGSAGLAAAENQSSRFASPVLLGWAPRLARRMQAHPWSFRVHAALKASGLVDWIKRRNRKPWQYPDLADATWLDLADHYRGDIADLETLLGRRIDAWHTIEEARRRGDGVPAVQT